MVRIGDDVGGLCQISVQTDGTLNDEGTAYEFDWDKIKMIPMSEIMDCFTKTLHEDIQERNPGGAGVVVTIYGREST
ncbi:MAG: hypothetical protein WA081_22155 [Desulfosalsimonadaceae bacterium]